MIIRKIKRKLRQKFEGLLRKLFASFEKLGFHILPVSFYSPIPNVGELEPRVFDRVSKCTGIDFRPEQQKTLLNGFKKYAQEAEFPKNEGLSRADTAILHCFVRHSKPAKVVEIGAGVSTQIIAAALSLNNREGVKSQFISIEPYLNDTLRQQFPKDVTLIEKKVQDTNLALFDDCDLLFIDSSHVSKIDSDVNFEFFEILPRLKPGALIHFHDILLPAEYWRQWIEDAHYFWNEQYLLQAFLMFNSEFRVEWASSYMRLNHGAEIANVFPFFKTTDHISSFWIRRSKSP
jgi:predicted O-methyltransferase YrrM